MRLWTPPGTRAPRATLIGKIGFAAKLKDGRLLRYQGERTSEVGPHGERQTIHVWTTKDHFRVIASLDETERWGPLLHVSMSYPKKNPNWTEIRLVKELFFGDDLDAMMVLPKAEDYINYHEHTFHIWETPENWGIQ